MISGRRSACMPNTPALTTSALVAITGRKPLAIFKRNSAIDRRELHATVRQQGTYLGTMDTPAPEIYAQAIDNTEMGR